MTSLRVIIVVTFVAGISMPASASVGDERLDFWGFAGLQQLNILADDDGASESYSSLETGIVLEGMLRYRYDYARLQSLRFDTDIRVINHPEHGSRSSERIRTRAEWRTWFSDARQTELRLRVGHEYKRRDNDWLMNRYRGQAELRHRLNLENLFFARVAVSARDYNEDRITDGIHTGYLVEVGHEWTPNHDWTRLRTRIGYEFAEAGSDRREYEGYYIDVHARHRVDELTDIFARGRAHFRDYGGAYDAPDPLQRSDERFRATVGAERDINDYLSLVGEAGWQANESNIEQRTYSGFVFRLGIEVDFEIWRSED